MKEPMEKSESLKKALRGSRPFDEAEYYKSDKVEMGGEDVLEEEEDEDEDGEEEEELYGDED